MADLFKNTDSWQQFYQKLAKDKAAPYLFEDFAKLYFLSAPAYKGVFRNAWKLSETPPSIKERLNLSRDHGVDIVLEDHLEQYSIAQVKFTEKNKKTLSWGKDKLSHVFAEAKRVHQVFIFTNAQGIDNYSSSKAKEYNLSVINIFDLEKLNSETLHAMSLRANNSPMMPCKPISPRDYQIKAVQKVIDGFNKTDRGQLILPCGSGKTLVALWVHEKIDSLRTLVLVPSLALLRQTREEWQTHSKNEFIAYSVCSENDNNDSYDAPKIELHELGNAVLQSVSGIKQALNSTKRTVIFCTYQSLEKIAAAQKYTNHKFDLIIADEAHRTAGSKLAHFSLVHNSKKIIANKRLYMTATPRIISAQLKSRLADKVHYLADMSDANIFGHELYRMTFKEAVEREILVDYKILLVGVSNSETQRIIKERKYISDKETVFDVASQLALDKAIKQYAVNHIVSYHSRVSRAKTFSTKHNELWPNRHSSFVSGAQSSKVRNEYLKEFRKKPVAVISNARCLVEGVDIPSIDAVYFCDPKNSKIDIIQAVGRAMRRFDTGNKKHGYIIVPIFHSNNQPIEEQITLSPYNNLINIIRALCDQDERLQDIINSIKVREGSSRSSTSFSGNFFDKLIIAEIPKGLQDALFIEVIEKLYAQWTVLYEGLKQYRLKNPTKWPTPLQKEMVAGINLGSWVSTQRNLKQNNALAANRENLLNQINFIWEVEDSWPHMFNLLLEYRSQFPDAWPNAYDTFKNKKLGSWCVKQRSKYKEGKLLPAHLQQLNKIDFVFNVREQSWTDQFACLKNYRIKYPDKWPSRTARYNGIKIGSFCSLQRIAKAQGELQNDRELLLNKIGFPWQVTPLEQLWDEKYSLLLEFLKTNNGRWPTGEEIYNGVNFGNWIGVQRDRRKKGRISSAQIEKLDAIKFPWMPYEEEWFRQFESLKQFLATHSRWPTSRGQSRDESRLASWVTNQRRLSTLGKLSEQKVKLLSSIGFTFVTPDTWVEKYNLLVEFRKDFPDRWPKFSETYKGIKIGNFCDNQRQKFRKDELSKDRVDLLEKIGFWR